MYTNKPLNLAEEAKGNNEESKEPIVTNSALFTQQELASFDYAGSDQAAIAKDLLVKLNDLMQGVIAAYEGLCAVAKVEGLASVEIAKRVLTTALPGVQMLLATLGNYAIE